MYQKQVIPNNADGSAAAPVHITLGNGGQWLSTQFNPYTPEWLAVSAQDHCCLLPAACCLLLLLLRC